MKAAVIAVCIAVVVAVTLGLIFYRWQTVAVLVVAMVILMAANDAFNAIQAKKRRDAEAREAFDRDVRAVVEDIDRDRGV